MAKMSLSKPQARVMKWLGHGWKAVPITASTFEVNGKKICNIDTLYSLQRKGLVVEDDCKCWAATEEGKSLTRRLCL